MEMKLNSKLIRELRLAHSWTQEQLAEKARLNPRTIQRVEMDGQGSLRTRAQLAAALSISPAELDLPDDQPVQQAAVAGWLGRCRVYASQIGLHALVLQILVTLLFVGTAEMYFSYSKIGFDWINFSLGQPWPGIPLWWVLNFALWASCSLPLLIVVWKRYRRWLLRAVATVLITLALSALRVWEPALTEALLTKVIFIAGLVLLACQWLPRAPLVHAEHLLYGSLFAYIYVWLVQAYTYRLIGFVDHEIVFRVTWSFLDNIFWIRWQRLVQLIPVTCVLLLAWGSHNSRSQSQQMLTARNVKALAEEVESGGQYREAAL